MSMYTCPKCGHEEHIFGREGVIRESEKLGIPILGSIPLDASICTQADRGRPTVVDTPGSPIAREYFSIAELIMKSMP